MHGTTMVSLGNGNYGGIRCGDFHGPEKHRDSGEEKVTYGSVHERETFFVRVRGNFRAVKVNQKPSDDRRVRVIDAVPQRRIAFLNLAMPFIFCYLTLHPSDYVVS